MRAISCAYPEGARPMAPRAEEVSERYRSLHAATLIPFYASLAHLSLAEGASAEDRARHLEATSRNEQTITELARYCPANHRHRLLLIAAERARVEGRPRDAA